MSAGRRRTCVCVRACMHACVLCTRDFFLLLAKGLASLVCVCTVVTCKSSPEVVLCACVAIGDTGEAAGE